jgi:hypothetical protein
VPYLNVMTRIEDRPDDELLYDLGGHEHPSIFFLDAQGNVLARHDADDPSVKALEETGAKVARSLDLKKKADAGDAAAKIDLAILRCDLGVTELFDLEGELEGSKLTPEQEHAVGVLRADSTVSDMRAVLAQNRDQAAKDMATGEFVALYGKGTHPAHVANRRAYWPVIADLALARKDVAMLKDAIAGLKEAWGTEPSQRAAGRIRDLEEQLKALEASK